MNINNQLGLATHPAPKFLKNIDKQLGFIGGDGQAMLFNADGGEYWAKNAQPNTSDDTLLMLNEDRNFLNALGDNGNWRNDRRYYVGDEYSVDFKLDEDRIRDKSTGKIITKDLAYVKSRLEKYALESDDLRKKLEGTSLNVTTSDYTRNSQDNKNRALANQQKWVKDRLVARLKEIVKDLENQIAEQEKAKAKADADAKLKADTDAFAKAKSANTIVSYTEYLKKFPEGLSVDKANQAIDEIKKAQKLKELEDAKKNASPEEKKQIDAEIDRLLGVSSGTTGRVATRMFLYGGVALVAIYGLYRVFKGNTASA
jgi:hypothetical protein